MKTPGTNHALRRACDAVFATDGYKTGHKFQYHPGTTQVIHNFTARSSRIEGIDEVIVAGFPLMIQKLHDLWDPFFAYPSPEEIADQYADMVNDYLMMPRNEDGSPTFDAQHLIDLHRYGHFPLTMAYVPEGMAVDIGTPMYIAWNNEDAPDMYWLTNYLETFISSEIWKPIHTATIAHRFRSLFDYYIAKTADEDMQWFSDYQGHDFSYRGMSGHKDAEMCGIGHLYSLSGSDCLPAVWRVHCDYRHENPVANSVPATEHAVMCSMGKEDEFEAYLRLLEDVYPNGLLSIVSDTWDYWKVLTEFLPRLKTIIMGRDGKLVIRPDTGDPVKILLGDPDAAPGSPAHQGTIAILDGIFGSTINSKGYKVLDPHIGVIYGDAINYERAREILGGLEERGYCTTAVVFGIGSYTYQFCTRDTFSAAIKTTAAVIDGEFASLFKDPVTDNFEGGMRKKSLRGLFSVRYDANRMTYTLDRDDLAADNVEHHVRRYMPDWIIHDLSEGMPDLTNELDLDDIRGLLTAKRAKQLYALSH